MLKRAWISALFLALSRACSLHGQEAAEPDPPKDLYTLHVYANLTQVPTLVMDSNHKAIRAIPRTDFSISLDGGPRFHPTQMRMQGEDPLSLAILLDASGRQPDIIKGFEAALAQITTLNLREHDRVSIYAVDCKLFRSASDVPASPAILRKGVGAVLALEPLHDGSNKPSCASKLHLWDAVAVVAGELDKLAGRRAILLVSTGEDHGSAMSHVQSAHFAAERGVAVFGLREDDAKSSDPGGLRSMTNSRDSNRFDRMSVPDSGDPMATLCATSGGVLLTATARHLDRGLTEIITLLRSRYILEYPRPSNASAGAHLIEVNVARTGATAGPLE